MKIVTSLLILCVCMPYLIHYGNAAGFIPVLPLGVVGGYGYGSGGFSEALVLLFGLILLFGFGGFGQNDTNIDTQDPQARLADILIKRSTLTGQALETYKTDIGICVKANKNQVACNGLGNRCTYIPTMGLCVVN